MMLFGVILTFLSAVSGFSSAVRPTAGEDFSSASTASLFGGNLEQAATLKCGTARMKCAFRVGCGAALRDYMNECAEVMAGRSRICKSRCIRALIALASTDEGQALMDCDCENQDFCELSKQRVEVCRPEVSRAVAHGTVVSCTVAEWICSADHLCSTALDYYNRFCGAMFEGRKCTPRCNNSIAILARQDKAAKLRTCNCDGKEEFPCERIRRNTNWLCFGREKGGQIGGKVDIEDRGTETSDSDEATEAGTGMNEVDTGGQEDRKFKKNSAANTRQSWHAGTATIASLMVILWTKTLKSHRFNNT